MQNQTTTATAPGKIILFGEHSVVYGRPAIAVPVNQVEATCQIEDSEPGGGLEIVAEDLGWQKSSGQLPDDDPILAIIRATLSHLQQPQPDLLLRIRSTIPIARGMGSGAAVSTAIVKALSRHVGCELLPQTISDLVYEVEKIHHGTPSGIDNTVVAFAQPIFFQHGRPIERLSVAEPLTFIIGDTGIESQTHKVVGDLRARRAQDVERYEGYFDELAAIAREARVAVERGDLRAIGVCMAGNHAILNTLCVSSVDLNRLVEAAMAAGAVGAKMSGAGWGGNMIALAGPAQARAIGNALRAAGAERTIVSQVSASTS